MVCPCDLSIRNVHSYRASYKHCPRHLCTAKGIREHTRTNKTPLPRNSGWYPHHTRETYQFASPLSEGRTNTPALHLGWPYASYMPCCGNGFSGSRSARRPHRAVRQGRHFLLPQISAKKLAEASDPLLPCVYSFVQLVEMWSRIYFRNAPLYGLYAQWPII